MKIWFLIIVAIILFAFFTIVRRWNDYSMLFTIAIGFAVNANIYNGITSPVFLGNIKFSIDAILYTGFTFTIVICAYEYGVKKAKVLTSSTIAAVLLSAVIEFFARISVNGYQTDILIDLFGYIASSFGTFVGVWVSLFCFQKLQEKKVNIYIILSMLVLMISIFNSLFYHVYYLLVTGNVHGFGYIVLGSYIGKFFAIILGLISFYINTHYWIPINLLDKYKKPKEEEKIDGIEG